MKLFSLETSQTTMAAASSTSSRRPRGMRERMYSMCSAGSCSRMRVCAVAGEMQLTAMSYWASSLPSDLVMPMTAAMTERFRLGAPAGRAASTE